MGRGSRTSTSAAAGIDPAAVLRDRGTGAQIPAWATPPSELTDAQLDRLDALEGRFPGSRFDLIAIEHAGARYEVETELGGATEIRIDPAGKVTELI